MPLCCSCSFHGVSTHQQQHHAPGFKAFMKRWNSHVSVNSGVVSVLKSARSRASRASSSSSSSSSTSSSTSSSSLILAVDVGTSSTKALLVRQDAGIVARASSGFQTRDSVSLEGGFVEQRTQAWIDAFVDAANACCSQCDEGNNVAAIVFSGTMQNTVVKNRPMCLLYSDTRAEKQASFCENILQRDGTLEHLSNYKGAASVLAKWRYLVDNEPDTLDDNKCTPLLFGAHSFVANALCPETFVCDRTTAATTGLLDVRTNDWAKDAIASCGLDVKLLPELAPANAVLGTVSKHTAERLGLCASLIDARVVQGCGDLGATTLGAGDGAYIYLGTSGWIATTVDDSTPMADGVYDVLHPQESKRIVAASMTTTGGAAAWAASMFAGGSLKQLDNIASKADAGCGGVIFMPHLAGERSPFLDPKARGAFLNISSSTGQEELARAVLEGVALGYRSLAECMRAAGAAVNTDDVILFTGGGAKSTLWPQILSDVLGMRIDADPDAEGVAARGAALLALDALGMDVDEDFMRSDTTVSRTLFAPSKDAEEVFVDIYDVFKKLYPSLRDAGVYKL